MKVSRVLANCGQDGSTCLIHHLGYFSLIDPSIYQVHNRPKIQCNHIMIALVTEDWLFV